MAKPFSPAERLKSFAYAFAGIASLLRAEHNARIHLAATVAVIAAGLWFGVGAGDWTALVIAITLVWMAEAVNTAFEALCDVASPEFHPQVKQAKDVAAAAVLIAAVGAAAVGLIVFLPHFRALF